MLVVTIAVITGFFIGQILDRLTSGIVLSIQENEMSDEVGTFSFCQDIRYTRTLPFSANDVFRCLKRSVWSFLVNSRCVKYRTGKTAAISLISALLTGIVIWHTGVTFAGLAALLCLHFLILLGFTDSETGYLPDCLTFPFLWTGLLVNINATYVPLHIAVISAATAYLVCWLANRSFHYISGNDGMGQGDFKMIAALGAWFGWGTLIIIVIMASFLAIVSALIRIIFGEQRFEECFPFGPYLAIATVPFLLYGRILMQILNDFS